MVTTAGFDSPIEKLVDVFGVQIQHYGASAQRLRRAAAKAGELVRQHESWSRRFLDRVHHFAIRRVMNTGGLCAESSLVDATAAAPLLTMRCAVIECVPSGTPFTCPAILSPFDECAA